MRIRITGRGPRSATGRGELYFEAAEAVCNPGGNLDLLEGLADLVDKNLIRQEGDEEPRFAMLETIREYAADTLQDRGEAEMILDTHASYFVGLAEEARASFEGAVSPNWLDRLAREHVNMRAALSQLLTQTEGDVELDSCKPICEAGIGLVDRFSETTSWGPASLRMPVARLETCHVTGWTACPYSSD